ncbi:MAG: hypothetical protein IPJ27_19785 [Candidatus Accumulibacter sp.]|uniref:Uncharacterized protein n=1 Tax=Candidatus Accumulibacter proximus TaxID=2954385 RepID=A0A935Q497_9PROT|nr:hypothetical protein [Candidatus Accumulibacter proximus]
MARDVSDSCGFSRWARRWLVGIVKAQPVDGTFQIKINRDTRPTGSDMSRRRPLAHQQHDSGRIDQRLANAGSAWRSIIIAILTTILTTDVKLAMTMTMGWL